MDTVNSQDMAFFQKVLLATVLQGITPKAYFFYFNEF